ncbi:ABC transporter ATP-binding protein [Euzebya sp.]|uniref:ABC transporter ATP-binding protein n=1 Tax=Euzebya sp. TaxID=1971409 RepID=UPI0035172703
MSTAIAAVSTDLAARASGVVKVYGEGPNRVEALRGVDLDLPAARFTAIMGPSGSGKSTLMHCLAGLDGIDGGRIEIGGQDVSAMSDQERTLLRRDHVGFVFQAFNLVPSLTALENITLPLDLAGRRPDQAWLDQLVEITALGDRLRHTPAELSGGQQQRVAVVRALITRPAIVFADEPTGNLDSRSSAELLTFLRRCVTDLGQTLVMVTHDPTAASYADRAIFLDDGRVVDDMDAPTIERILDRIKVLEA